VQEEYEEHEEEKKGERKKPQEEPSESDLSLNSVFPTVTDKIISDLPEFFSSGINLFESIRERDVFFFSLLSIVSGALPNVFSYYDNKEVYPNLFLMIVAPSASSKGAAVFAKEIGKVIHKHLEEVYKEELENYRSMIQDMGEQASEEDKANRPKRKLFFIPADSSSTSFLQLLKASDGRGVLFDTETDTLGMTLASDWGNYSHHLRKIFQHEDLSISRVGYDEVIEINEPKVSVVLSGTAGQIRKLIPDAENGLFSRFMFYAFNGEDKWKTRLLEEPSSQYKNSFKALKGKLLDLYKRLSGLDHDVQVYFTEAQIRRFDKFFLKLSTSYKIAQGDLMTPTIRRIGLINDRIATILTLTRYIDQDSIPERITCSDKDFSTALKIADILSDHSSLVLNLFPKDSPVSGMNDNKANFYKILPDEFPTQVAYDTGASIGILQKTVEKYLKIYIDKKILIRIRHGYYKKVYKNL